MDVLHCYNKYTASRLIPSEKLEKIFKALNFCAFYQVKWAPKKAIWAILIRASKYFHFAWEG
jgi:hypothetical protein